MKLYAFEGFVLVILFAVLFSFTSARAAIATEITIERFVYDGYEMTTEGDEYVKLCNISGSAVDLSNGGTNPWRLGDDEIATGGSEGMYEFPNVAASTVGIGGCIIIARNADAFNTQWGMLPDLEFAVGVDNVSVANMTAVDAGPFFLANGGDNITLWRHNGAAYVQHDEVAYGSTTADYTDVGLPGAPVDQISCTTTSNCALTRNNVATDTDNMVADFNDTASPTAVSWQSLTVTSSPEWLGEITAVGLALLTYLLWKKRHAT